MEDAVARRPGVWAGLLDRLWRILAWSPLIVILLIWVAVVLVLSANIPQAPLHSEDPIVRSQWLAHFPIGVRPMVEQLQTLGIFNLLDSVWLRLPLALLLAHTLVMLADLGPAICYRVRWSLYAPCAGSDAGLPQVGRGRALRSWLVRCAGRLRPDRPFDESSRPGTGQPGEQAREEFQPRWPGEVRSLGKSFQLDRDWPELVEQPGQQLIARLQKAGYRILSLPETDTSGQNHEDFFAWRWRWSWLGLAGIYLGLGLASIGLILESWLGQVQEVNLVPDSPVPLPVASAPNLVLDEVMAIGEDPLGPVTGVASMRVLTGVGESRPLTLRLHNSRLLRGMWLTLTGLRGMAEVTAVDAETGENVLLQPFSPRTPAQERVRLILTGDPERRFVGVPSQNVTLRVDYQADAEYPHSTGKVKGEEWFLGPTFSLSFFRGAEAQPSQSVSLDSGDEVTFERVRYRVAFEYDAMLRTNSSLWWVVIAVGWGITALSFILLTVAPPVYVRGSLEAVGQGSRITLTGDVLGNDEQLRRELRAIVIPDA